MLRQAQHDASGIQIAVLREPQGAQDAVVAHRVIFATQKLYRGARLLIYFDKLSR